MIKRHEIVNCENTESVTSHDLYPLPCHKLSTLSQTPSPLERDILYGRPHESELIIYRSNIALGQVFNYPSLSPLHSGGYHSSSILLVAFSRLSENKLFIAWFWLRIYFRFSLLFSFNLRSTRMINSIHFLFRFYGQYLWKYYSCYLIYYYEYFYFTREGR